MEVSWAREERVQRRFRGLIWRTCWKGGSSQRWSRGRELESPKTVDDGSNLNKWTVRINRSRLGNGPSAIIWTYGSYHSVLPSSNCGPFLSYGFLRRRRVIDRRNSYGNDVGICSVSEFATRWKSITGLDLVYIDSHPRQNNRRKETLPPNVYNSPSALRTYWIVTLLYSFSPLTELLPRVICHRNRKRKPYQPFTQSLINEYKILTG